MRELKQQSVIELIDKHLAEGLSVIQIVERFHNSVIVHALSLRAGNVTQTAELLKTSRNNLVRWMFHFGITRDKFTKAG